MPYAPGVQNISGQLLAQGIRDAGQNIGEGIRAYQQNKLMAGQAIGKFEGATKADPNILQFLNDPSAPPEASKAYKKLMKDGTVGVKDAAILAMFADTYLNQKQQQEMQQARARQAEAAFLRAQQASQQPPTMSIDAVRAQFPEDKYDATMVPVPNAPGQVQVKSVSPRAPVQDKNTPVPVGNAVNIYDPKGNLIRRDDVSPATPSGYKANADGSMAPVPGGPADAERKAKDESNRQRVLADTTRLDVMVNAINEVMPKVGASTAGVGALLSSLPGTPAYDMAAKLDTLKANIGFQQLAQMRAASPTGGALGQVAVKELDYLQAALGNLDKWQSPAQLKETLKKIQTHLGRWKKAVEGVNPDDETVAPKTSAKPASQATSILQKYGIK